MEIDVRVIVTFLVLSIVAICAYSFSGNEAPDKAVDIEFEKWTKNPIKYGMTKTEVEKILGKGKVYMRVGKFLQIDYGSYMVSYEDGIINTYQRVSK